VPVPCRALKVVSQFYVLGEMTVAGLFVTGMTLVAGEESGLPGVY